jgi:serine/threonine protein phosphatase PrpC
MNVRDDVEFGELTHVGVARSVNQDALGAWEPQNPRIFALKGRLLVVCDGMGGGPAGEVASRVAVETIIERYKADDLDDGIAVALDGAIQEANAAVFALSQEDPARAGMGTTTVVLVHRKDRVTWAHVGDSRLYRLRDGVLERLTRDHSLVQKLQDDGALAPEDVASFGEQNVILRSVGVKARVEVETGGDEARPGDAFLLCSDGLCGYVSDEETQRILNLGLTHGLPPAGICKQLVDLANAYGGHDNVTVQLLRLTGRPAERPSG